MDILAHGLWSGAAAYGARQKMRWAGAWGVFPDLFAFSIPTLVNVWHRFTDPAFSPRGPHHMPFLDLAWQLYQVSHSLVIFSVVFALVWRLAKRPVLAMFAWGLHILMDIPTHTMRFFPTPFLWPLSSYKASGISWGDPWFMLCNYSALLIVYSFIIWSVRKRHLANIVALCAVALAAQVTAAPKDEYVRVSPRDCRYLELTDGTAYIPIGLNMISPPRANAGEEAALRGFEEWLTSLAANGGNYIRVWLSNPFWDVEHERSGVYDGERARRIDRMLEMCRQRGIRVKMTMEHFRSIGGGPQAWADKPLHHVSNGGTAASIADFFDGEASRAQFRRKIAWYRERYGDQPIIYGWELWNEVNAVRGGDYLAWTEAMLPELHSAFPKNMAMQSLGSFDAARVRDAYRRHSTMPGNDLAQVHRYLDLGASLEVCKGPVDVLAADAVRELRSYEPRRPVILAESGAVEPRHSGPFKLYAADRQGILLHDILFAPFFAGAAGPGQIWHWDVYVAANNLWWQFGRFAEAVGGLDPAAEGFEPSMIEHERLRVYLLRGQQTLLAWCRDKNNTWESELRDGRKPEPVKGASIDFSAALKGARAASSRVYDPWTGRWRKAAVRGGRVRLPDFSRSIVVNLGLR